MEPHLRELNKKSSTLKKPAMKHAALDSLKTNNNNNNNKNYCLLIPLLA
jgi:hypothetical protein